MRDITVIPKYDKIKLASAERFDVFYDQNDLQEHCNCKLNGSYDPTGGEHYDDSINRYRNSAEYVHNITGNSTIICNRPSNRHAAKVYATHNSSWDNPQSPGEVRPYAEFLRVNHNTSLRVSEAHLAIDIYSPCIDNHEFVCKTLSAGKKSRPRIDRGTWYYGDLKSGNSITVYDKAQQLEDKKDTLIDGECTRIEFKCRPPKMNNFLTSLDDLADQDWSWLYGKCFSFLRPNEYLMPDIEKYISKATAKAAINMPLWKLRDLVTKKLEMTTSNFNKIYLEEVPELAEPVKKALAEYRWRNKK